MIHIPRLRRLLRCKFPMSDLLSFLTDHGDLRVVMIFAMSQNRVIGIKGDIPWHIPDDLKRFKALTLGHACIMGRKTCESIVLRLGKSLPGRSTIVLSRSGYEQPGVMCAGDALSALSMAADHARAQGQNKIFICGGAEIYALFMPIAHTLYATVVDEEYDGDAVMPAWDEHAFALTETEAHEGYSFMTYERSLFLPL